MSDRDREQLGYEAAKKLADHVNSKSDLIERLLAEHEKQYGSPDIDSELIQAADEIERLTAECNNQRERLDNCLEVMTDRAIEIRRLRAECDELFQELVDHGIIAREALKDD